MPSRIKINTTPLFTTPLSYFRMISLSAIITCSLTSPVSLAEQNGRTVSERAALAKRHHPSAAMVKAIRSTAIPSTLEQSYAGQRWLSDMGQRLSVYIKDEDQRNDLLKTLHRISDQHQLMPELVLAIIEVESHFRADVTSHAGAQGLMQVMPFWKKEINRPSDNLFHPETNLQYGCAILAYYLRLEQGNLTQALARYNGSYGQNVYSQKVMTAWNTRWNPHLP